MMKWSAAVAVVAVGGRSAEVEVRLLIEYVVVVVEEEAVVVGKGHLRNSD